MIGGRAGERASGRVERRNRRRGDTEGSGRRLGTRSTTVGASITDANRQCGGRCRGVLQTPSPRRLPTGVCRMPLWLVHTPTPDQGRVYVRVDADIGWLQNPVTRHRTRPRLAGLRPQSPPARTRSVVKQCLLVGYRVAYKLSRRRAASAASHPSRISPVDQGAPPCPLAHSAVPR